MRPYVLTEKMISFVSDAEYDFDLQHISYLNKLPAYKKRETLSLTRIEYECLKKIITGLEQTHYKHKQEYINWFSQHCMIADPVVTELDTTCVKKKNSKTETEAQIVGSSLTAPSARSAISRIPYESKAFLDAFKKQYRKERPWYGIISEKLGLGLLSKLKKQSTDAAIEYLQEHAKKDAQSTTAHTLNSLFKPTDFVDAFKAQYRKERPWYGALTEFFGGGVINKLNDRSIDPSGFLRSHSQAESKSTTAKTLAALEEFAVYGGGVLTEKMTEVKPDIVVKKMSEPVKPVAWTVTELVTPPPSPVRQLPVSSEQLSVEALIKAREFSFNLADLEKKEVFARSELSLDNLALHEHGCARMFEHEKIERTQISRSRFLKDLEGQLKVFWLSFESTLGEYVKVADFGVTKVQCHLNFYDEAINNLIGFFSTEHSIKIHRQVLSIQVLYRCFNELRDFLECPSFSDEKLIESLNDFTGALKRLHKENRIAENVFKSLWSMCDVYQMSLRGTTEVSATSCAL